MALDVHIAASREEAVTTEPAFSISEAEHKSVFHTPSNRFSHLVHLSAIADYYSDSQFQVDSLNGLVADIEDAKRAIENPSVLKILEGLQGVCSKAVESGGAVFCFCD